VYFLVRKPFYEFGDVVHGENRNRAEDEMEYVSAMRSVVV
jgi:hypothetical protein